MAPAVLSPAPTTPNVAFPLSPSIFSKSRRTSGFLDSDSISNHGMSRSVTSRRVSSRKFQSFETSNITNVVHSLKRRSGDEIGATASSKLLNATHASLIDWIRTQRMSLLPPEGSNYDKVLAWAQLFVDRLHSFDLAIEEFAGDSYLAAQLAYGYCALLLELGKGNENALMTSFGFFYSTSTGLVNLLERIELFNVTQEIREQLVLALADLVTLIASVATYFHQAIRQMTGNSATVNIYMKFPGQIQAFRQRCEKIAESMWRHQLQEKGLDGARVSEVKTIRSWLAPEDTVLANVAETTSHLAHDREEMTCVWVGPHLTRFLRNRKKRTFAITGKSGSGKTVLSSVIVDHLQHPIGGVMHKTLYIPINGRLPAETRPRAIVKTILFQLFEKRIGNIQLFQILWDALERSKKAPNDNDYDNILWNALEHALAAALKGAKELVIVIDGVDEAACDEAVLLQKLTNTTAKATNVKLITLGAQHPPNLPDLHHYHINDDGIYEDICAVVRGQFKKSNAYDGLDEMGQSLLVSQITSASKGSFLWAKLASKRVRDVDNADNLRKAVDALVNAKPSITDLVLQILNELPQSQTREDAKLMLLWLATANRPLSVKELKALASIQPEKQTITEYTEEPRRILHAVNSLVFLQEDQVLLRHSLIRTAVLDIFSKGKLVPTIKDRHADLVTRLLVYIKATVTQPHEPSLTPLEWHDVNPLINKHPLLEFSIRYWITHFRQTNVFVNNGEVPAAKEFAKLFPSSITVFLLQNTLWENRPTPELLAFTTTVTNVCRQVLTNNHVVTLQLIITLAFLYRQLDYNPEAIPLFYEATIISRNLLTIRHLVTMKMAATFLEITSERVTSTKTEIMTKREEILLVLVECYKHHYDSTHENVINTLKQLVEHYRLIKEDKKAEEFAVTIRKFSGEYSQGRDTYGNLNVHLKGGNVVTAGGSTTLLLDIEEHDQLIEVEAWSFEALIKQAEGYVAEGNFELAERTYVEIWQRLSRESRVQYSAQVEERKIQSVLAYTQFLKTQKREYEASSILSSVWQEYEQTTMALSETSVFHLQEMAKVMKTVGLATLALTVFKHCSHYYQSTNRTQSSTYQEIQQSIHTTSKEVMQSFSSSSTTVTSETTLEEMVYEASASITTVDQTSFSATQTLFSLYVEQRRWQDATRVIKKVLHGVWSSLFAPSLQDVALPAKHVESCIELAERLSHCYHSRRRLTKEEDIRVRIYRAVRSGRNVDDKLRERITNELLRLFERTSQTDKIINLRQETLNDCTKHYGPENPLVVKILWTLAELTRPRPVFVDYYQQIIRILNKDSPISHPEAFEPLVIVATELWKQGRYSDALLHYQIIFTTFLTEPKQSPRFQDQTFVHEFFERYTHCLRSVRTEFSVLHQVTVEYQTKCKAVFSATASITLKATLTLAKLCQESKRYELEAISLYEELLKTKSEEIDLQEISSTLDAIYEEQAAIVTSTKTESFSSTQVERAVKVLRKRISTVRETHGWAHEESLTKMEEMIKFHAQRNETQTVVQELKEATVQILSSETSSTRLIAAATTIASSYIATNQIQKATELTQEIYRQIVMKDTSNSKSVQFDLSSKERQSLTFLAQLEYSLRRSSSTTITEILAALTTEYVYFEEFRKEIKSKSSFHSVSVSAARLYQFLIAHERHTAAARVFDDFVAYFINTEGKRAQLTEISQVKIFVLSILDHFSAHQSENFIRSVGITSNDHVVELLKNQRWETASDLALAAYKYIIADASYHTPEIVKFVFTLGLNIGGRDLVTRPDEATRKKLLQVSGTIIQDALRVITSLKINLAGVSLVHLNKLIGLLGEQQDYRTLAWLLTILWNSREAQRNWPTSITLALGRRFIMARYLIGDYSAALRLAEDIVYNCRRVHGPRHLSTLEMSILLSQLYTGNAQRYQAEKNGQEIANRFYKKSAAVHENILRVFSDPDYAELEGNDSNGSFDGSAYGEVDGIEEHNGTVGGGEHVRQHLHLLKLSVERLGDWPKEYAEYEKLNADVFRVYNEYLVGVEGVEKWNLKNFGGGKAESNEDALDLKFKSWELVDTQNHAEIEEEL